MNFECQDSANLGKNLVLIDPVESVFAKSKNDMRFVLSRERKEMNTLLNWSSLHMKSFICSTVCRKLLYEYLSSEIFYRVARAVAQK